MKTNRFYTACVLLTMTLLLCVGCSGGGTTGTGGLQFSGTLNKSLAKALRLKAAGGEPIVGALVTLAETGESDLTNDEGFFEINSSATGLSSATLIIEGDDLSSSVFVENIPDNAGSVELELEADLDSDVVTIVDVIIEEVFEEVEDEVDDALEEAEEETDDALEEAEDETDDALEEAEQEIDDIDDLVEDELDDVDDLVEDELDDVDDLVDDILDDVLGDT